MPAIHILERAYQLARSGDHRVRSGISRALTREGYTMSDLQHLEGSGVTRDLNRICREAQRVEA